MKRHRSRRCQVCGGKFYPDIRQKNRQRCCSRESCQDVRHSQNVRDWYLKNPDCLKYQRAQTRHWFKNHPDYQKAYRQTHPGVLLENRQATKVRMSLLRNKKVFDKMNSSFLELVGIQRDECYLNTRSGWVHMRLKKQTRYAKYARLCKDAACQGPRKVRPLSGRVYNLAAAFAQRPPP